MVVKSARLPAARPAAKVAAAEVPNDCEVTVYCPGCTAFETVWFLNGRLMETQKFTQVGELLFHDCGTGRPCRLYRPL